MSLKSEERETVISWDDDDTEIFIHTTQRPMIRRLQKNPLFRLIEEHRERETNDLVGVSGHLPLWALTIRRAQRRVLSKERREAAKTLHQYKKPRQPASDGQNTSEPAASTEIIERK